MPAATLPIGKCIYCGSTQEPLGREHAIPFGLNGTIVLPKASCARCATITSELERYCLRRLLGNFRVSLNFRTRRKRQRPGTLPLTVQFPDGREETLQVSADEYPWALHLPVFPPARALRGLTPDATGDTTEGGGIVHFYDETKVLGFMRDHGLESMNAGSLDPQRFARFIAKIAHSAAVSEFGVDSFAPLATGMILGESDVMNYLVGCGWPEDPPASEALHTVRFKTHEETGMIIVFVRLFVRLGTPEYHVLVGVKPGGHVAKVLESTQTP